MAEHSRAAPANFKQTKQTVINSSNRKVLAGATNRNQGAAAAQASSPPFEDKR